MTVTFLDTNVFLYAAGADHPLRRDCQQILRRVAEGNFSAITSTEVVQEILYVLSRRGRSVEAITVARSAMLLFPGLLPVTRTDMLTACGLLGRYPGVPARDVVHAATMLNNGITSIVSADGHFDDICEVRRIPVEQLRT
jgi:predicted nucleic acid-binding protein